MNSITQCLIQVHRRPGATTATKLGRVQPDTDLGLMENTELSALNTSSNPESSSSQQPEEEVRRTFFSNNT